MRFDEKFLQEMGLASMPEEQKQAFLDYIQEELEVRIGERISRGLTETQLNEFDMISDPPQIGKCVFSDKVCMNARTIFVVSDSAPSA